MVAIIVHSHEVSFRPFLRGFVYQQMQFSVAVRTFLRQFWFRFGENRLLWLRAMTSQAACDQATFA